MATIKIFFRDETIDEVSLNEGITTIGRDVKNDIQVDNLSASGRHAEIINHNSICMLTDLDSTNGTFVNGNRINKPHNLQEGDIIAISKHTLKFYDTSSNKHSKSNHVPQEHHISDASETMMMNKSQLSSLLGDHKIED
ncbi:MAG: FHA domain-containing protein, partial [Methylococcales bacterium]|nr:FHA domain-containing protein [Methylococcales bacterium]